MSSKISKVARQHEKTWSLLHKRLVDIDFEYKDLFEENVWTFLNHKAASLSTSVGYLVPSILATTAFIASTGGSLIKHKHHEIPFNLYFIFVGPPSTGKSQALKEGALEPISTLIENDDLVNCLIEKCTSSGLAKTVAGNGKGIVVSPELFDLLNKLLKSDDDNATGDAQLLCELFTGERISYRYATEKTREIEANVPFTIIGATQVPFAARLITRMDQGHGLLDRFLFLFPSCLRPTIEETEEAVTWIEAQPLQSVTDIFLEMFEHHGERRVSYNFEDEAQVLLNNLQSQEIQEINQAIMEGNPPPKCKRMDLIKRLSGAIHIFNHVASKLIDGIKPDPPAMRISANSVMRANNLVLFADSQKQVATEFINSIVTACVDKETKQPSLGDIKASLVNFPGPIVTYRGFKQYGSRSIRTTSEQEFVTAVTRIGVYGRLVSVRLQRQPKPTNIFLKASPDSIDWDNLNSDLQLCKQDDYEQKYNMAMHSSVGPAIKTSLVSGGHVSPDLFN